MKYRKKPVVIDAVKFTEGECDMAFSFITCNCSVGVSKDGDKEIYIQTLEGTMTASIGDWIIKGVQGEFYPCKPDIFAQTYELVEAS